MGGRDGGGKGRAHSYCLLPYAAITAGDDDSLPRLIGDIYRSPGRLGREELAKGPNTVLRHVSEFHEGKG